MEQALTVDEVMGLLKLRDRATVYSLVRRRKLAATRVGRLYRFDPEAVRAFLRGEPAGAVAARRARRERPSWLAGVTADL